jgi:hypothetical protein
VDESAPSGADNALNLLRDHEALSRTREALQTKSKSVDLVFQARISAMVGVLNLFLDPGLSYTWREASMIVAKA